MLDRVHLNMVELKYSHFDFTAGRSRYFSIRFHFNGVLREFEYVGGDWVMFDFCHPCNLTLDKFDRWMVRLNQRNYVRYHYRPPSDSTRKFIPMDEDKDVTEMCQNVGPCQVMYVYAEVLKPISLFAHSFHHIARTEIVTRLHNVDINQLIKEIDGNPLMYDER